MKKMNVKSLTLIPALAALMILPGMPAQAGRMAGEDMATAFPEIAPPGIGGDEFLTKVNFKAVDWAQPPLGCVEDMVPHRSKRPCLDLSYVVDPRKDWPEDLSPEDKAYWWAERRGINVCRSEEVLRRERANPGSQNPNHLELAWMSLDSIKNAEQKVAAVYESSRTYGVPLQVLTGAIYQESLFSELGIADDGGNFSCGVEQINLIGWCEWANKTSAQEKKDMNWPQETVACNDPNAIQLSLFKPIYNIAKTRLNGLPEYRLKKEHFANIPLSSFVHLWPAASPKIQQYRYSLIRSFIESCSDYRRGILAKGHELSTIFNRYIPQGFKDKDRYTGSDSFRRSCKEKQAGNVYPLHSGWLLAVSAYNAGPRSVEATAHYNGWSKAQMGDLRVVKDFNPTDMVKTLYWTGKYNPSNDLIEFLGFNGSVKNWPWFKGCVVQRHIARVMQHMTLLPEFFVDTLEGAFPCARSTYDASGRLIKTAVPEHRQNSSGRK